MREGYKTKIKWTKPSDKLPEYGSYVLTTIHNVKGYLAVRSGFYHNGIFHNDNGCCYKKDDGDLIAWAYLPEPYDDKKTYYVCERCGSEFDGNNRKTCPVCGRRKKEAK